ncbi:MAG: M1 family aminopeptidase [Pyrinomonadaceae bacterium]
MKHIVRQQKKARRAITLCLVSALVFGAFSTVPFVTSASGLPRHKYASGKQPTQSVASTRTSYDIAFALDFDKRTFTGSEQLHWVNEDDQATGVLYFHLYSNARGDDNSSNNNSRDMSSNNSSGNNGNSEPQPPSVSNEPRTDVTEVRDAATNAPLAFFLDDRATTLRVNLREPIAVGASIDVLINFTGSVPEIDPDETGLLAHVLGQVDAALRRTRELRRARDINFRSRGVMLLGSAYPVLAARISGDWHRKVEPSIGDMLYTDVADYRVRIEAPNDIAIFASVAELASDNSGHSEKAASSKTSDSKAVNSSVPTSNTTSNIAHEFAGEDLRNFAFVAGRNLRSTERVVGKVRVRAVYMTEHETVARRALSAAADAVRIFNARFGEMPYRTISVVDAPLVAGLGSAEFAGFGVIASAFYVDFDQPAMRNLPELIREQRASVEDSLEWTVAHTIAHQWWGEVVGNDPERTPVLDEALANWSALAYYQEAHGEARAAAALDDQLRGVYRIYRTFGGEDSTAVRAAREYRNFFQYAAIVTSKGALMFAALRRQMGDEKFFAALGDYYAANRFEIAELIDLRDAFFAKASPAEKRQLARTLSRWLAEKHGDEDIAPPDPHLAESLGLNTDTAKSGAQQQQQQRNKFARLGKFFWQQMTRIR